MNVVLYKSKKEDRRARQNSTFESIKALPAHNQPKALFQAWPQRIPQRVWRQLTRNQKHEWLALCLERIETALAMDEMADYIELGREALKRHRKGVKDLLALAQSLPGRKVLTVVFSDPFGDEETERTAVFSYTMDTHGTVTSPTDILPLEEGLALSLCERGGLSIRQEMTLKVLRVDENGQENWVPQERIYGIQMRNGQWGALSAADMKRNYNSDPETGEPMPMLAGLSFGDLTCAAKRIMSAGKQ